MSLLLIGSRSRRMSLTWSFHSHLRLSLIGYHIGQRLLALHYHRLESPASSLTGSSLASAAAKAKPSRRKPGYFRLRLDSYSIVESRFW